MENKEKEIVLDTVKEDLLNQIKSSPGIDDLSKSLTALKLLEEIKKTSAEGTKAISDADNVSYQKRNDMKKFGMSMIAPIITALGLLVTLVLTVRQNRANAEFQNDTQNYDKWKTLVDKLNGSNMATDPYIPILLTSFYDNDKYRGNALAITTNYLSNVRDEGLFKYVIEKYTRFINVTNYKDLVALTRNMEGAFSKIDIQAKNDHHALISIDSVKNPTQYATLKMQTYDDENLPNIVEDNFQLASEKLKDVVLRLKDSTKLDLSNVHFYDCNLDSVDFKNAIINDALFDNVSVKGADFSKVTALRFGKWDGTAWWRAQLINPKLLLYLVNNYPINPNTAYYNKEPNDLQKFDYWKHQVGIEQ